MVNETSDRRERTMKLTSIRMQINETSLGALLDDPMTLQLMKSDRTDRRTIELLLEQVGARRQRFNAEADRQGFCFG